MKAAFRITAYQLNPIKTHIVINNFTRVYPVRFFLPKVAKNGIFHQIWFAHPTYAQPRHNQTLYNFPAVSRDSLGRRRTHLDQKPMKSDKVTHKNDKKPREKRQNLTLDKTRDLSKARVKEIASSMFKSPQTVLGDAGTSFPMLIRSNLAE